MSKIEPIKQPLCPLCDSIGYQIAAIAQGGPYGTGTKIYLKVDEHPTLPTKEIPMAALIFEPCSCPTK